MSNVLSEAKKQQVIALGRLGWPLRRIEQETGVRRETAGAYLKAAGIGVRPPGAWGRRAPAKPANENGVPPGSDAAKPANTVNPNPNPENLSTKGKAKARTAKPANENAVTTGFGVELSDFPAVVRARAICLVSKGPLSLQEIEARMRKEGYVSKSRSFRAYLRNVLKKT
jgi:hypothetical protein